MRFSNILLMVDSNTDNDAAWLRASALAVQQSDIHVVTDVPSADVPALVREHGFDLVIKPVAKSDGFEARVRRRDNFDLIRSCPCPVWLVNDCNPSTDTGAIVAALDMPLEQSALADLNQRILDVARSVALAEFRPLHVVHAWQPVGEGLLRSRASAATRPYVDRMLAQQELRRWEWLNQTVTEARSESHQYATEFLDPTLHLIKGSAKQVVPELADQLGAQLIVIGTAARKGVAGFIEGNTSEKVLTRTDCSLLIVNPEEWPMAPTTEANDAAVALKKGAAIDRSVSRIPRFDRLSGQYGNARGTARPFIGSSLSG